MIIGNYFAQIPNQTNMLKINPKLASAHQYKLPFVPKCKHKLDVIQNYYEPHPDVLEVFRNITKLHEYPYATEIYAHLKELMAVYCDVQPSNITFTGGSDMALKMCLEAFATNDAIICVPVPTYPHFESFLDTMTVREVRKPQIRSTKEMIKYDFTDINLAYIVSPNLPLGYTLSSEDIYSLTAKWPNTMFVVDGAYVEYQPGDIDNAATGCEVVNIQNLILVRTFSKAFGLAGLRIGYFIASNYNTQLMSPLINDKNVTTHAIACAYACMQNLDWYQDQILDIQVQKEIIHDKLTKLIGSERLIYDFSIRDANFFIIYSRNTSQVCKIFADHGIMIRDKSADIPDAIRICMGPSHIMKDVMQMIEFCNLEWVLRKNVVAYDLDLTLRNGPSIAHPLYPGVVETLNARHATNPFMIISNTCESPDEVHAYLTKQGVTAKCNIITGFSMILDEIDKRGFSKPMIVGASPAGLTSKIQYDCIVITNPELSMSDLVNIAYLNLPVITIRDSKVSAVQNSYIWSEWSDNQSDKSRVVPELGLIADILRRMDVEVIKVGKTTLPYLPAAVKYMFGDSKSDRDFAYRFGATFYEVGNSLEGDHMRVASVNLV